MNAPSTDIKDVLVSEGAWVFATDLFISAQPATPMNSSTIFDTTSTPPDGTLDGNDVFLNESIMIWVRNSSYQDAYSETQSIISILHNKAGFTVNGTKYLHCTLASGPNTLTGGVGEGDYSEFSINFNMIRERN